MQDRLSEILNIDMSIYLRRRNILVSEQLLNDAQIRTILEHVSSKRVAKRVWRDRLLYAGLGTKLLDNGKDHHARKLMATPIKESEILLTGLNMHLSPPFPP